MNALKPCPFCPDGGDVQLVTFTGGADDVVHCHACGTILKHKIWQTRPIEDEQAARIAELEARAEKAEAMVEKLIEAGRMMKQPETIEEFHRGRRDYNALVAKWKEQK